MQALHGLARFLANGVRDREDGQGRGPIEHRDGGLTAGRRAVNGGTERAVHLDVEAAEQGRAAEQELTAQKDLPANLLAVARATAQSPGLEVTLEVEKPKEKERWVYTDGLEQYLKEAVGGGDWLPDPPFSGKLEGKREAVDVKVGDRILFGKYSGTTVKIEGTEYLVMREEDIMGVVA